MMFNEYSRQYNNEPDIASGKIRTDTKRVFRAIPEYSSSCVPHIRFPIKEEHLRALSIKMQTLLYSCNLIVTLIQAFFVATGALHSAFHLCIELYLRLCS